MSSKRFLSIPVSAVAALVVASTLLGCPLLKKKSDAGPDDGDDSNLAALLADAATVHVGGTGAKNEASVLRYANEEKLDEPAIIGKDSVIVRNFPGNGPAVATLYKGTAVLKVAKYFSTGVLILFDEAGTTDKLLGWVPANAFASSATATTPTVAPTTVPTVKPVVKDAGAVAVVDAGGASPSAAKDAGGGGTPVAVVDAGGGGGGGASKLPQPPRGVPAVAPVGGQCPDNWAIYQNMCRRICAADADCPKGTFCLPRGGKKLCTADK